MSKQRVAICVPARDDVRALTAMDLAKLVAFTAIEAPGTIDDADVDFVLGTFLVEQRTALIERALTHSITHVLFIDADMRFPSYALCHLLARHRQIIGVNYRGRYPPHRPVAIANKRGKRLPVGRGKGVQPVYATGFGVMLIAVDVFRRLPRPWFTTGWTERDGHVSDDTIFCVRVAETLRIPTYVDHDLSRKVGHLGVVDVTGL